MNQLYIAYFFKPDDDYDCDVFVASDKQSRNAQFIAYAKNQWGIKLKDKNIKGILPIDTAENNKRVKYQVLIKKR